MQQDENTTIALNGGNPNAPRGRKGMPKINLPSYDTGIDRVPEDQPALLHQDEAVIPAEDNPNNPDNQLIATREPVPAAEKTASGMGQVEMPKPSETEAKNEAPAPLIVAPEPKESKPASIGSVLGDQWLQRIGVKPQRTAPTLSDNVIPPPPSAEGLISRQPKIPGFKPMVLPPDPNATPDTIPSRTAAPSAAPTGKAAYQAKIKEYETQHQQLMDKAASTNDPQYAEQAARVQEAKSAYEKQHPWGSPESAHPGIVGKIGHVAEEIASRSPFGISAIASTIPGSEAYRAAQGRNAQEQVKESSAQNVAKVEKDTPDQRTMRALLEKGYTLGKDEKGNTVLNEVPGFRDSSKDMQSLLAATVQDEVAAGRDPMQSPNVQRIMQVMQGIQKPEKAEKPVEDFATFYPKWLKDHLNAKDNSHNEALARKEWAESGQTPPQVLMMQPNAQGGQTGVVVKPGTTVGNEVTKPGEVATASRKDIDALDKAYVQPANAVEKSYDMMDHAYQEYEDARAKGKDLPTGAQSMVALSTHLSTTFGNVKGSRITKDMIQEHLGARGVSDKALVAFQKLSNGDVLSPDQWEAFHSLISESRTLSWQTAVKEAERKHVSINFLPDDLTAVKVPGHAASTIHTSQLQDFQKKYPNGVVLSEKE